MSLLTPTLSPYTPAHKLMVKIGAESGSITESTNGTTAATLPAVPTMAVLGYTNLPQTSRGLGNSKAFALGYNGASYNKQGRQEPNVSLEIRVANAAQLALFFPDEATGALQYLCLQVLAYGQWTDSFRFCKPERVSFQFTPGEEIVVSVTLQATAFVRTDGAAFNAADLLALGTPLFWHDLRVFTLQSAAVSGAYPDPTNFKFALASLSVNFECQIERKVERDNFGSDSPLSRTNLSILEHHLVVTGEMTINRRWAESWFSGANNSQEWGDATLTVSNTSTVGDDEFTLTLLRVLPSDESMQGGESSTEVDFTIPYEASSITITIPDPEEE